MSKAIKATTNINLKKEYPFVWKLLNYLAGDNGFTLKKSINPKHKTLLNSVETECKKLNSHGLDKPDLYNEEYENEFEILAMGEETDLNNLVKSKNLQKTNNFVYQIFDGDLNEDFVEED